MMCRTPYMMILMPCCDFLPVVRILMSSMIVMGSTPISSIVCSCSMRTCFF